MKLLVMFILVLLLPSFSSGQVPTRVWFETVWCGRTTGELLEGKDDLYILTSWKLSNGESGSARRPDSESWEIGRGENLRDLTLWEGNLSKGQSITMIVVAMEKDGGAPGDILTKAGRALDMLGSRTDTKLGAVARVGGGLMTGIGTALNVLRVRDPDDLLGSFAIRLTYLGLNENRRHKYKREFKSLEAATYKGVPPKHPERQKPYEFELNKGGATYRMYIRGQNTR